MQHRPGPKVPPLLRLNADLVRGPQASPDAPGSTEKTMRSRVQFSVLQARAESESSHRRIPRLLPMGWLLQGDELHGNGYQPATSTGCSSGDDGRSYPKIVVCRHFSDSQPQRAQRDAEPRSEIDDDAGTVEIVIR